MLDPSRKYAEIAHGQKIADQAEAIWGWDSPAGRVRAARRAELLLSSLRDRASGPVLELGCGSGVFTRKFTPHIPELFAIDISVPLLQRARQFSQFGDYCVSDAEVLPFADGTFAAVIGSSVLHHLNVSRTLVELRRILRSGGRIAFAEPNMLNPQIVLQKNIGFLKEMLGDSPDETAFVRWIITNQLYSHGFENVHVYPYDFLHPIVPLSLIPLVNRLGRCIEGMPVLREIAGSLIITADAI